MANVLRTHTIAEPRGFMKMLIGKDSDEIVGFTAFGIEASELMAAVQTAMVGRLPYTVLRYAIFAHPTMSEGLVFLLKTNRETQELIGRGSLAAGQNERPVVFCGISVCFEYEWHDSDGRGPPIPQARVSKMAIGELVGRCAEFPAFFY